MISLVLILILTASFTHGEEYMNMNPYTRALRKRFEDSFLDKCLKYPFVKQWENLLEHTTDRYVTFIYHEPGLRNGGLGDRISGVINAVGLALRFNRTLLIESQNGFHELFQPFHSTLLSADGKGASKVGDDYKYTWKKENWTSWSNWSRKYVDNDSTEFDLWYCVNNIAWRGPLCSMDSGDVPQQHIKLRGNRNYLCKWATHPDLPAHSEFFRAIAPQGVTDYSQINLMEVAGCMMRLAMWPTEALWQYVDASLLESLGPERTQVPVALQVGAHFRCGDRPSYLGNDRNACIHDPDPSHQHEESSYMAAGAPDMIGACVRSILDKPFLRGAVHPRGWRSRSLEVEDSGAGNSFSEAFPDRAVFIASDNDGSAQQINATAHYPLTIVSPKGCHVELDPSFSCSQLTVGYWLILSSSDVIVTQTDNTGSPISAFSRYAAVYGLKGDSLRDAKDCGEVKAMYDISRRWTGNWFCD
eukprot:GSChrysophyteH1.ASY1.ANO1.3272.1 assembled CDS